MRIQMGLCSQIVLALALSIASSQAQRSDSNQQAASSRVDQRSRALAISPRALMSAPTRYLGQTVLVRAEISEVLSAHAFALDNPFGGGDPLVLVPLLTPYALATHWSNPLDGRTVTVAGTLRLFDRWEFEREYGWFSINLFRDWGQLRELEGRPVVVAESMRTEAGRELVQPLGNDQGR